MLKFVNIIRSGLATGINLSFWLKDEGIVANVLLFLVVAGILVPGCGGPPPKPKATENAPQAKSTPKGERAAADAPVDKGRSKPKDSGIPLDIVFFDDPLGVASNKAVIGGSEVAVEPKPADKPPAPAKSPGGGSGEILGWNDFITTEMIQSEIKRTQNRLASHLANVGTYNGNYKDNITADGAVVAALAEIVIDQGAEVGWKANAPHIRNFGSELSKSATGLGQAPYEKSKTAFEKLKSTFSGSLPADAGPAAAKMPYHEVAGRRELMKRIQMAKNWMRDNINNEAKLKSENDAILHEAAMISTLGKVISLDGYGSADEEEYKNFAKALIDGGLEATEAAKEKNLKRFQSAMDKVNKSCDQCHANYGTG